MTDDDPELDLVRLLQFVEHEPQDTNLRFDLARSLVALNRSQEAIPHLQQARSNPHLRRPAMLLCADAFDSLRMFAAAKQIRDVFDEPPEDQLPPPSGPVTPPTPSDPIESAAIAEPPTDSNKDA